MKYLIAGLGNIGPEYKNTRHNIGFDVVDYLAEKLSIKMDIDKQAYIGQGKYKGRVIYLIKPTTYMNLSGKALNYWMKALNIPVDNTLTILDDLAIPYGAIRMRAKGSSAGHNGLKDIETCLGTNVYPRIKFGIGDDYPRGKQIDFVLGKFTNDEKIDLSGLIEHAGNMALSFCSIGLPQTMNQMNKK